MRDEWEAEQRRSLGSDARPSHQRKTLDARYKSLPLAHGCLRAAEAAIQAEMYPMAAHWIDEALMHAKDARKALGDVASAGVADFARLGFTNAHPKH